MDELHENVIEWITGDDTICCTLTQRKYITKVKNLINNHKIDGDFRENADGSIFCHLPLSCLKLSPKSTRTISDEQREAARERLAKVRASAK